MSTTSLSFGEGVNPIVNDDGSTSYQVARTERDNNPDGTLRNAWITFDPNLRAGVDMTPGATGLDTVFLKVAMHEVGHTMGLGHPASQVSQSSVMNYGHGYNDSENFAPVDIKPCDQNSVSSEPGYPSPTPTPTPTPEPTPSCGDYCWELWL